MKPAAHDIRERGSAFFVALTVLGILTMIGLSLAVVTETEMLLGSNERVIGESFFAAEAGVTTTVAKLLVTNSLEGVDMVVPSSFGGQTNYQIGYGIQSTGLTPVERGELPYSKANAGSAAAFHSFYYYGLIRAQRTSWRRNQQVPTCDDFDRATLAERLLFTGFYYAPVAGISGQDLLKQEQASFADKTQFSGRTEHICETRDTALNDWVDATGDDAAVSDEGNVYGSVNDVFIKLGHDDFF